MSKERKFPILKELEPFQVGMVMLRLHSVKNISFDDRSSDAGAVLHIYREPDRDADRFRGYDGIYTKEIQPFKKIILEYNHSLGNRVNEVMEYLRVHAETVVQCSDPDLIPVNNGIFDYRSKKLPAL